MPNMVRWSVALGGEEIDRVSYLASFSAEEVRASLVEHDGYSPDIVVTKVGKNKKNKVDSQVYDWSALDYI